MFATHAYEEPEWASMDIYSQKAIWILYWLKSNLLS